MRSKLLNSFIWIIDVTQKGTTNSGQSAPGRIGNEGVLHIPPNLNIRCR